MDEALEDSLRERPGEEFDLIDGLVGVGVYALERPPGPAAARILGRVVSLLADRAEREAGMATWVSSNTWVAPAHRGRHPARYHNLGLAHGVPGVVALLGAAAGAGVDGARPLMAEAARWVLDQEQDDERSRIPRWVVPGEGPAQGRTAWCYGDPGAAAGLFLGARAAGAPDVEAEALRLARAAGARPPELSGVRDASLCHGAAGLGHLFHRLHRASGDPELRAAAIRWFERTLAMREPGAGVAGFSTPDIDEEGRERLVADPGVLVGAAGVALALLAAATDVEPAWDRFMLLSTPAPTPPR